MSVQYISKIYLILIILPIYIFLDGRIYNDSTFTSAQVLPLSFFLTFVLGITILFRNTFKMSYTDILQMSSVLILLITFLISFLFIGENFNINLILLYFIPQIFAYLIGKEIIRYFSLEDFFKILIYSLFTFSSIHLLDAVINESLSFAISNRGTDNIFGIMSIYQKLISYPLVLSIIIFFASFLKLRFKYLVLLILVIELIITAAREPLAMLIFMYLIYFIRNINKFSIYKIMNFIYILLIIIIIAYFLIDFRELYLYNKIILLLDSSVEGSNLSGGRIEQLKRFYEYLLDLNIFIGEGFIISNVFPEGTFHNQWVEYFVKGGIFFPISILLIFLLTIFKSFSLSKIEKNFQLIGILLIALILVSFNINTPLRTPYSSIIIWLMIGYVSGKYSYKNIKGNS